MGEVAANRIMSFSAIQLDASFLGNQPRFENLSKRERLGKIFKAGTLDRCTNTVNYSFS